MNGEVTVENYEQKREELIKANSDYLGVILREDEEKAALIFEKLKAEYREKCGGMVPYDIPVLSDKSLTENPLYKFCSRLPKGADLHVHDMSLLPARELIKLLKECDGFYINGDGKSFDLSFVNDGVEAPKGYVKFSEALKNLYTEEQLIENWTVLGAEKSGMGIWDYFEELFNRHGAMSSNPEFAERYYEYTFRYYCEKNIMHIEIHQMLTDSIEESEEYLKAVRSAYYAVKKDYPYFTVRIIGAGAKADNENIDLSKKCFLNASYAQETIKDESEAVPCNFIIGFDLVNEEDTSLPLHTFAPMLLKVKKQFPDMKLYIHGGESLDAHNENLIDAYLLGVSRVGHGLNLYRYPDLHSRYVKDEICLEVCPISNQRLGYTRDIRNHPATEYLRTGVPITLCSDDPAYMENETLTDDFFAAAVGWDLSLAQIKQLGINSIMYSGLDGAHKTVSLKNYNILWNEFIAEITK